MPIYDYACTDCGHRFEHMHEMVNKIVLKCPNCGGSSVSKLISVPGLIRNTDRGQDGQTCCGRTERCERPPCTDNCGCHRQHNTE
ncbi:MAG: zinc ribbon domain-containing protein [Dehalococcoidia bacterium]